MSRKGLYAPSLPTEKELKIIYNQCAEQTPRGHSLRLKGRGRLMKKYFKMIVAGVIALIFIGTFVFLWISRSRNRWSMKSLCRQ